MGSYHSDVFCSRVPIVLCGTAVQIVRNNGIRAVDSVKQLQSVTPATPVTRITKKVRVPIMSDLSDRQFLLKIRAARTAIARNHRLGTWTDYDDRRAFALCTVCGMEAYVDAKPAPNGIDISGEAVARHCSGGSPETPETPVCSRRIKISYDVVTPESAKIGDFADSGWEDEEGVCIDPDELDVEEAGSELAAVVKSAVKIIGNGVEASDYPNCYPGCTWYTEIDAEMDYSDGSEKRLSYHLEGFSEEEELAIYAELTGKYGK